MSMDLSVKCPHCDADVGKLCTFDCEVNGSYMNELKTALANVDMSFDNICVDGVDKKKRVA